MTALLLLSPHDREVEPETYFLDPAKLIDGNPRQRVWPAYSDARGQFHAGVWESAPGAWRITYTEDEYCELLDGVSILTDAAGHAVTLRRGDRFVIPSGFVGTWQVVETTRKVYVIHEAPPTPSPSKD